MAKYKYTIYAYTKSGNRTLKHMHHSSFTSSVRTVMNNVKNLTAQHKKLKVDKGFTVKFEKINSD